MKWTRSERLSVCGPARRTEVPGPSSASSSSPMRSPSSGSPNGCHDSFRVRSRICLGVPMRRTPVESTACVITSLATAASPPSESICCLRTCAAGTVASATDADLQHLPCGVLTRRDEQSSWGKYIGHGLLCRGFGVFSGIALALHGNTEQLIHIVSGERLALEKGLGQLAQLVEVG